MKHDTKTTGRVDTGAIVKETWRRLANQLLTDHKTVLSRFNDALERGIDAVRRLEWPCYMGLQPEEFQKLYQVQNYGKRFIFKHDLFTEDELTQKGREDFCMSQQEFGVKGNDPYTQVITTRANRLIRDVLGEFCFEEFCAACRWAKNASSGLSRKDAYLDVRLKRVTGTAPQITVLRRVIRTDARLNRIVKIRGVRDFVNMTMVPKSFKSHRVIAPDTIAGGFLSAGLGALIQARLELKTPIKLATAPPLHNKMARDGSLHGKIVTLDLSKASDSFTIEHAKLLLPLKWRFVLQRWCRTETVMVGDKAVKLKSLMLMGSGHTFPLQTLIFYALIKSICEQEGYNANVRVFGDDCIFDKRAYGAVCHVFAQLGLTINRDKTFASGPFRESCGGDYHTGRPVRPTMPEGVSTDLMGLELQAFIHKLHNGLTARWKLTDISDALDYLESLSSKDLFVVPESESDEAGFKTLVSRRMAVRPRIGGIVGAGCLTISYSYVARRSKKRKTSDVDPYIWDTLRLNSRRTTSNLQHLSNEKALTAKYDWDSDRLYQVRSHVYSDKRGAKVGYHIRTIQRPMAASDNKRKFDRRVEIEQGAQRPLSRVLTTHRARKLIGSV